MRIHEIPGKLVCDWSEEGKAMIDTWENYTISVDQFREAILKKGLSHAKANKARGWIMDAAKAKGALPDEVQKLIETEVFKAFAAAGIKYFLTIKSQASTVTNMSIKSYSAHMGPQGLQMVEVPDQKTAIAWLKAHAA